MSWPVRLPCLVALASLAGLAGTAVAACGEDHATVRDRPGPDSGTTGGTVQLLACGVPIPTTYDSPAFATNAKEELDLRARALDLDSRMRSAEGAGTTVVTTNDLAGIYAQGTPSLRSTSTSVAQAVVDGYLTAFGDAVGKTWTLDEVTDAGAADAGATTGGKYDGGAILSPVGLDIREATSKTLLGGALYNHALVVASGPVTEATVDRFVAIFGASTKLANTTDPDAGPDEDVLIAEFASKRDDKSQTSPGTYRRMKTALLSMKAAAAAGDKCKDDLDAALQLYLAEWERTTFASAIYFLNDAAAKALAQPQNGPIALQSLGDAIGFIESFKGVAPDRRKITDAQIDDLLGSIGEAAPYELLTNTSDRVSKLVAAIQTIAGIYGFSTSDVEAYEKVF